MIYIVEYTTEDCVGNQCLQMEIEAVNKDACWDILEENYPDLAIDCVYAREL